MEKWRLQTPNSLQGLNPRASIVSIISFEVVPLSRKTSCALLLSDVDPSRFLCKIAK